MQTGHWLFAYFGPEVQLPLVSIIGAISGVVLLVGRAPIRLVKRWFSKLSWRKGRPESLVATGKATTLSAGTDARPIE